MARTKVLTHKVKCPLSGKACINCAIYRGRHFNVCFQDHYRGDSTKGTGPLISMGYPAAARVFKRDAGRLVTYS
jgi:hypothetical protein